MNELKIGDVLWQMEGHEQNGVCKFYAIPKCIEYIDEHKVLFGKGYGGGSLGLIGKMYFTSRQECLDDFLEKHDSLEEPLPKVEDMEERIHHEERTDFQDFTIVRDDTITNSAVYIGGLCNLKDCTNLLKWISEPCEPLYMNIEYLSLTQIYKQVQKMVNDKGVLITVIVNDPLHAEIYQCGNHEEGKWEKLGRIMGYA